MTGAGQGDLDHAAVALRTQLAIDMGDEAVGVDHPDFRNAECRINTDLAAAIVGEAGVGDLDREQYVGSAHVAGKYGTWKDAKVRLQEAFVVQPQRRFLGYMQIVGSDALEMPVQFQLHHLMASALGQHRHHLPADQFEPLMLVYDAGRHHRLDFRNRPRPARQAFRGLRGRRPQQLKMETLVHGEQPSTTCNRVRRPRCSVGLAPIRDKMEGSEGDKMEGSEGIEGESGS
jgi:hypothetical protein